MFKCKISRAATLTKSTLYFRILVLAHIVYSARETGDDLDSASTVWIWR